MQRYQLMIMYTHVFSIHKSKFSINKAEEHTLCISQDINGCAFPSVVFFFRQGNIYHSYYYGYQARVEISQENSNENGLASSLYHKILSRLQQLNSSSEPLILAPAEKRSIHEFLTPDINFLSGEGGFYELMLFEFKKSFAGYKATAKKSVKLKKIARLIENFYSVNDVDFDLLEEGKYQAIEIETKFDTINSHAESILTDGRFLFWINRGGGRVEKQLELRYLKSLKA